MKHFSRIILAVILAGGLCVPAFAAPVPVPQDPEVQYQRAVQLETIEGNMNAAIDLYRQVIKNNGNNRAVAAKALLRLGGCYEKQGNAEASKAYEQLLREYADQVGSAAEARTRLVALHKPVGAVSGPSTRRIWADSKTDFFGSVSPDGKYLSFVDWETGGNLAVRDLEKGINRLLTKNANSSDAEVELSIWSPDGKQVAYQWLQWKTEPYGYELRLISLDDPTPRVLYRNESSGVWIEPFDWSPDGKQILAQLNKEEGSSEMVLVSVADGKVRTLKKLSQSASLAGATISPDGGYVLYDYPQTESALAHDIFLLPIAGGSETTLIEYPADDRVLGWAPGGKWILFASDRRGSIDVWAVQTEDGKPKGAPVMVKPAVGRIHPLGFTRRGSFYFGVGGGLNNIFVVRLDPTTGDVLVPPTKLIKQFEGSNRSPRYSPDGKRLAYISKGASAVHDWGDTLYIRSLETGEEREYQREIRRAGLNYIDQPRWSPDGKSILLFGQDPRSGKGIYHINLETGKIACVLRRGKDQSMSYAAGWRDEKNFLYGRLDEKNNRGELYVRNLDDGSEKVLFSTSPAARGALAVSPDRRWVSATESHKSGERALGIISTDSGEVRRVIKFSQEQQFYLIRHDWSADSKYVFYTRRVETQGSYKFELWRIAVDGGQPQKTGLEMSGTIDNISAHPDGEQLAFQNQAPMSGSTAEVWVMENFLPK